MFIPLNTAAYTPNTLNRASPKQANQSTGNGFFTTPGRTVSGKLARAVSPTFADVWSQPRLFYNSLLPIEQQFLINAIRFEMSHLQSQTVKENVIIQLNRISNDIATRVARVIGVAAPTPDPTFYNNNVTSFVSIFNKTLLKIDGLKIGVLASVSANGSITQGSQLKASFAAQNVDVLVVGETLANGVDLTYSAADATAFDGIIVADGADGLFTTTPSPLFPAARPLDILSDGFRWGKPIGALGSGARAFANAGVVSGPGVFVADSAGSQFVADFENGLKQFKFLNRFAMDS
jgi:catalase